MHNLAGTDSKAVLKFERETLPNGMILLSREDPTLPYGILKVVVDLEVSRHTLSPTRRTLAARMFMRGTTSQRAEEIFEKIEGWGGNISASSGDDSFEFNLMVPTVHFEEALRLFNEVLNSPAFTESEFKKVKMQLIQDVQAAGDEQWTQVQIRMTERIYPGHPYGTRVSVEEIESLKVEDVKGAYKDNFCPERVRVLHGGGFSKERIREWATGLFNGRVCSKQDLGSAPNDPVVPADIQFEMPKPTSFAVLAFRGPNPFVTAVNSERAVMHIAAHVLARRIFDSARLKAGISYTQWAFYSAHKEASLLIGYIEVAAQDNIAKAKAVLEKEFRRLSEELMSEEEFYAAVKAMITQFDVALEATGDIIESAANGEIMHGKGDKVRDVYLASLQRVTPEYLQEIARKYFSPDRSIWVIQIGAKKR